jgi:hypothetical protein
MASNIESGSLVHLLTLTKHMKKEKAQPTSSITSAEHVFASFNID